MSELPAPPALFSRFLYDAGNEAAARVRFQTLITDLVRVSHGAATEVAGPGGQDWGIDTYVGRLDDSVVVWQSKFFLTWTGEDQRGQVRESFKHLLAKSTAEGFAVSAWTLCVPCVLPPDEQKWFDGWAGRQKRDHAVTIALWNGVELRGHLMRPDAVHLRDQYFGSHTATTQNPEPVQQTIDLAAFDDALFVRQLLEAGQVETDAARGLFFAAEALARDLASRGDHVGVLVFEELHLEILTIWELMFNSGVAHADGQGRIAGLVDGVLSKAGDCPDPSGLMLRPSHRRGVAHRLVEDARAGWVRHWREVAASHRGTVTSTIGTAQAETFSPDAPATTQPAGAS
jgi:hypothetical protein